MPSFTAPVQILCYFLVQILLGLASAILFLINCSAFILYGVTALFGPIFVPLLMTKSFRAKFFHFLDVLIGFAMIRAVAAAFIFVWSGFMNGFIQQTFNGNYSMEMWLANLIPCMMVFIAFIINMLFIPSMTQAIFGGAAAWLKASQRSVGAVVESGPQEEHERCFDFFAVTLFVASTTAFAFMRLLLILVFAGAVIAGSDLRICRLPCSHRKEQAPHVQHNSTH